MATVAWIVDENLGSSKMKLRLSLVILSIECSVISEQLK